eukprot:8818707-Alexandrium_andersonii.AAC.2
MGLRIAEFPGGPRGSSGACSEAQVNPSEVQENRDDALGIPRRSDSQTRKFRRPRPRLVQSSEGAAPTASEGSDALEGTKWL